MISSSCNSGYQKLNGEWKWITYNTGSGRYVEEVEKADIESFKVLELIGSENENLYAIDKNSVYYRGRIIQGADPESFSPLKQLGYSKDKSFVFLDSNKIILADPSSFHVLGNPYSKDSKRIFNGTIPLYVENPWEFRVTKSDDCLVGTRTSDFIKENPEYSWLDTINVKWVYTGCFDFAKGETKDEKFIGYKKVK